MLAVSQFGTDRLFRKTCKDSPATFKPLQRQIGRNDTVHVDILDLASNEPHIKRARLRWTTATRQIEVGKWLKTVTANGEEGIRTQEPPSSRTTAFHGHRHLDMFKAGKAAGQCRSSDHSLDNRTRHDASFNSGAQTENYVWRQWSV